MATVGSSWGLLLGWGRSLKDCMTTLFPYRRLQEPPGLVLDKDAQLDTMLRFLTSVPPRSFLHVQHGDEPWPVIAAMHDEPPAKDHGSIAIFFGQLLLRATHHCPCKPRLQQVLATSQGRFDEIQHPLHTSVALRILSSIGLDLAEAAMGGEYQVVPEAPLKTPTECLATILDVLDAEAARASSHQLPAIRSYQRRGEQVRLRSRTDMATVTSLLREIHDGFASASSREDCVRRVAACAGALLRELAMHGADGPPRTRLRDNVDGRVWETLLNAALVNDMPSLVVTAARTMRIGLLHTLGDIPPAAARLFPLKLSSRLNTQLPRPWSHHDPRLHTFRAVQHPTPRQLDDFLRAPATTGFEVLGDYFVTFTAFEVLHEIALQHVPWMRDSDARYFTELVPLKGTPQFNADHVTRPQHGSGITLAHQKLAAAGQASTRAVLVRVFDLADSAGTPNLQALACGIPFGTGMSGNIHWYVAYFVDLQRRRIALDMAHAVLGVLIFLVHEGGHSWNEGIQTLNFLEKAGAVGSGVRQGPGGDPALFVADYVEYLSTFEGTATGDNLARALEYANKMTVLYHRNHGVIPIL